MINPPIISKDNYYELLRKIQSNNVIIDEYFNLYNNVFIKVRELTPANIENQTILLYHQFVIPFVHYFCQEHMIIIK